MEQKTKLSSAADDEFLRDLLVVDLNNRGEESKFK